MTGRYVLVALARPRAPWLDRVVQLANSGAMAAEVHQSVGLVDLLAQVGPSRRVSAVLLDGGAHGVDRDLVHGLRASSIAVLVIADPQASHDWASLGADAVVARDFAPHEMLDALIRFAHPVPQADFSDYEAAGVPTPGSSPWDGALVAVIGPGGTGVSTVAIAAAHGLGRAGRGPDHSTALIDLRRCAEQAMLHDIDPTSPGLLELVDLCRLGSPDDDAVRAQFSGVTNGGYDLLPGLRRSRLWMQLRPASSQQALNAVVRTYAHVVADLDSEVEGESDNGSIDVEERHQLTRLALQQAAVVLVVAHSSMKGMHSVARLIRDVVEFGVHPNAVQPVFNHAANGSRARAGYAAALAELTTGLGLAASPVFLPTRDIDDRLRALVPFPNAIVAPIHGAIEAHFRLADRPGDSANASRLPNDAQRVDRGFLGRWKTAS